MSKTTKTLFTITDDELLVEEVSKNRVLYDSSHEKHKDVNFKDVIWNNISSVVGQCGNTTTNINASDTTTNDTTTNINASDTTTNDTTTNINASDTTTNDTTTNDNVNDTTTNDNVNDTTTNVNTNDSFMDFLSEESSELFEEDNTTEKSTKEPNFNEFQKPNKKFKSKYNKKDFSKHQSERAVIIQNLHKQNETILNKVTNNDETDLFFQSIAAMVKKLPPRGISEARLQVLKTISELEDKYLINPHIPTPGAFSTTSVSEYDYNIAHSSSTSSCQSLSSNSQGFAPFVYENNFTNQ
ncbi:hypothetical protein QTP88_002369 [Uroleucon formosanum]